MTGMKAFLPGYQIHHEVCIPFSNDYERLWNHETAHTEKKQSKCMIKWSKCKSGQRRFLGGDEYPKPYR